MKERPILRASFGEPELYGVFYIDDNGFRSCELCTDLVGVERIRMRLTALPSVGVIVVKPDGSKVDQVRDRNVRVARFVGQWLPDEAQPGRDPA